MFRSFRPYETVNFKANKDERRPGGAQEKKEKEFEHLHFLHGNRAKTRSADEDSVMRSKAPEQADLEFSQRGQE